MNNDKRLRELAARADKVVMDRGVQGKMGLHISSKAWSDGKIDLRVMTAIPYELTPREAMEYGWALFRLGKYGDEMRTEEHDIDDDDFFRD